MYGLRSPPDWPTYLAVSIVIPKREARMSAKTPLGTALVRLLLWPPVATLSSVLRLATHRMKRQHAWCSLDQSPRLLDRPAQIDVGPFCKWLIVRVVQPLDTILTGIHRACHDVQCEKDLRSPCGSPQNCKSCRSTGTLNCSMLDMPFRRRCKHFLGPFWKMLRLDMRQISLSTSSLVRMSNNLAASTRPPSMA